MYGEDAATVPLEPWRQVRAEANRLVRTVLRAFVAAHRTHAPEAGDALNAGRDALYAYFQAAQCFFYDQLDIMLAPYKERILALSLAPYLRLLSTLHVTHLVLVQVSRPQPETSAHWFSLLSAGLAAMYGRPEATLAPWRDRLAWFREGPQGPARIVDQAYAEIAALVGPAPARVLVLERLFWMDVEFCIAERAKALYTVANWPEVVDAELANPERGYAEPGTEATSDDFLLPARLPSYADWSLSQAAQPLAAARRPGDRACRF